MGSFFFRFLCLVVAFQQDKSTFCVAIKQVKVATGVVWPPSATHHLPLTRSLSLSSCFTHLIPPLFPSHLDRAASDKFMSQKIKKSLFSKWLLWFWFYLYSNHYVFWSSGHGEYVYVVFIRIGKSNFSNFLSNCFFFFFFLSTTPTFLICS